MTKQKIRWLFSIILFIFGLSFLVLHPESVLAVLGGIWRMVSPLFFALLLAFILEIPTGYFESKIKTNASSKFLVSNARLISLVGVLIVFFFALLLILIAVLPKLWESLQHLLDWAQQYLDQLSTNLEGFLNRVPILKDSSMKYDLLTMVETNLDWSNASFMSANDTKLLDSAIAFTTEFTDSVTRLVVIFVLACYLVCGKNTLLLQVRAVLTAFLPDVSRENVFRFGKLCNEVFTQFFSRQCLEALIFGGMCFLGMLLLNLPYALPICFAITISAVIPIFGSFFGGGIGVVILFLMDPLLALEFLVLFLLLQNLEGNFIYPKVVGSSIGLPPVWSVFMVFVGGNLLGILGILLSVPVASVLYRLFREWVFHRLRKKGLESQDLEAIFYREKHHTTLSSERIWHSNEKPPKKPQK